MNANSNTGLLGKWEKLLEIVDDVYQKAETAARNKETEGLLELTNWLRRARELQTRLEELASQADRLIAERVQSGQQARPDEPSATKQASAESVVSSYYPGGKARADECRETYVARELSRGRTLKRLRRGYYKDGTGATVGVTYSSEDKRKTWPWFLNLQEGHFDEAVLLCEVAPESVQVVRLPKTFFSQHAPQMSRDQKGQVKFNLSRRNERFLLKLRDPDGPIDVTPYIENEPLVCPHREYE